MPAPPQPTINIWYTLVDASGHTFRGHRLDNVWVESGSDIWRLREVILKHERYLLETVYDLYSTIITDHHRVLSLRDLVDSLTTSPGHPIELRLPEAIDSPNEKLSTNLSLHVSTNKALKRIALQVARWFYFDHMSGIGPMIQDVLRARLGVENVDWIPIPSESHMDSKGPSVGLPRLYSPAQWAMNMEADTIMSRRSESLMTTPMFEDLEEVSYILSAL